MKATRGSSPVRKPASAIELPALVQLKAAHVPQGRAWAAALPDLVAELERRWSIRVQVPLSGGSAAYVARARTADGALVVLKIAVPGEGFAEQVTTLRAAQGQGYARLLAWDLDHQAVLLEALGPPLDQLGLPPQDQIAALCVTLRTAWRLPLPVAVTLAQARAKAHGLAELVSRLWEELDRPCSERAAVLALTFARRRAELTDLERVVVAHGDPHPGNALRVLTPRVGGESGFVFVDPDGFVADPAYDLGVILRDWCSQLLAGDATSVARRYCRLLAAGTGIEETAIWEWGYLERVSTGLYLLQHGAEDLARPFLDAAERLAAERSTR